jgi:hypothetical protein
MSDSLSDLPDDVRQAKDDDSPVVHSGISPLTHPRALTSKV